MDEICVCGHKKEEHLDDERCQVKECSCARFESAEPPAAKHVAPPPGIFGGVTRPGTRTTR